ncbi:UDP-glucuronate 4-epimerase 4 [Euphorbia peplus]|nr:UDP-glucuronate 4-epimerase 4 [Euphorbia peplus]
MSSSSLLLDTSPPLTPSKFKPEKSSFYHHRSLRSHSSLPKLTFYAFILLTLFLLFFVIPTNDLSGATGPLRYEKIAKSVKPKSPYGLTVLVTGAAGFVGTHVSIALKRRGDGVLGIDNFNQYYDVNLKRARQRVLEKSGIYIVEGDVNDVGLLENLFASFVFTHMMHLAAQAGVRYAMQKPQSYVRSNTWGFVNVLEVCKSNNPQPVIVWASSSSVYGLNKKVPFAENHRTDQPASLNAATKKTDELIAHTFSHIYGLSITGLRFFTVYGPWGRPDMAYYSFTRNILKGKGIGIYETSDGRSVARDFTYIDDIVKGCLRALDTAKMSIGSGGKKTGKAQFGILNLGNTSPVPVSRLVGI